MLIKKLKDHHKNQKHCKIYRTIVKGVTEVNNGYIVDQSSDFLILQETDDFQLEGFRIFPTKQISKLTYTKNDQYYDKILEWEGVKKDISLKTTVKLKSWKSIFKTFRELKKIIVVECEDPEIDTFTIGRITRVTDKKVFILYFNAQGYWDEKATPVEFKNITNVLFDDRYINTFSKYTRKRKKKP